MPGPRPSRTPSGIARSDRRAEAGGDLRVGDGAARGMPAGRAPAPSGHAGAWERRGGCATRPRRRRRPPARRRDPRGTARPGSDRDLRPAAPTRAGASGPCRGRAGRRTDDRRRGGGGGPATGAGVAGRPLHGCVQRRDGQAHGKLRRIGARRSTAPIARGGAGDGRPPPGLCSGRAGTNGGSGDGISRSRNSRSSHCTGRSRDRRRSRRGRGTSGNRSSSVPGSVADA